MGTLFKSALTLSVGFQATSWCEEVRDIAIDLFFLKKASYDMIEIFTMTLKGHQKS